MQRSIFLLVLLLIAIIITVNIVYFLSRTLNREQEAKEIIEGMVRMEFLPSQYELKNGSEYANIGFGRKYADHLYIDWRINNTYIIAVFGYDIRSPHSFMGYTINIWVKDPQGSGAELAREIFNSLPDSGWKQAGPNEVRNEISNISCVIWDIGSDKAYVKVINSIFKEPENVFIPDKEPVQSLALITYYYITPFNTNPIFDDMAQIQESDLWLWGGADLTP